MSTCKHASLRLGLLGLALLLGASQSQAHHSFAMFDMSKKTAVTGTVRDFEWTNPHVWLWVDVTDAKGTVTSYGFEGAAPGELSRTGGWTKHSVNKGDKITVEYSPLKDGRAGGTLGRVTTADGKVIGRAPGAPGAGAPGGPGGPGGFGGAGAAGSGPPAPPPGAH